MVKRTLYFGNEAYLSTQKEQLVVRFPGGEKPPAFVPVEDVGIVVLDHYRLTFTQSLVSKFLANNVALISCNAQHLPQGLLLNLDGNHVQTERFAVQIGASVPLKKNLWQQTVQAKINNQAALLARQGVPVENMLRWATEVKSGDPDNLEARAAAYYWKHLFSFYQENFSRGREGPPPNAFLNYGYAILRALMARSLVASGMLPTLGIHHHNKYNAYCLADDVMEPYRPFVDERVLQIVCAFPETVELTREIKQELLQLPVQDVLLGQRKKPLMVAVGQTTASLYESFAGNLRRLKYPEFVKPEI